METRIKALIVVLLIALTLATALASNDWGPAMMVLISLIFSEAGLLGLWAALGKSRLWVRSSCVTFGLICLWIAIPIASNGRAWADFKDLLLSGLVVALPALLVFLILQVLQRFRGLRLVLSPPLQALSDGFQFSLKHLMAATAIVAVILAIRNGLQNLGYERWIWTEIAVFVAVIVPCVLLVELATFWAALGLSRPIRRLMVVIPSGFLVGIVPAFFFMRTSGIDWREYAAWSGVTGVQASLTTASLLVFRSCGWRLCRTTCDENQRTSAAPIHIEKAEPSSDFDA